jgi:hypothetical protein
MATRVKYTRRYKLGQLIGSRALHFPLMTATPHNGNSADFQLFMGLLDTDRFERVATRGRLDVSDLMRRLTKEDKESSTESHVGGPKSVGKPSGRGQTQDSSMPMTWPLI